jgi:hypothetical protein
VSEVVEEENMQRLRPGGDGNVEIMRAAQDVAVQGVPGAGIEDVQGARAAPYADVQVPALDEAVNDVEVQDGVHNGRERFVSMSTKEVQTLARTALEELHERGGLGEKEQRVDLTRLIHKNM